ncbi:MAG: hypothetical protein LBC57_01275 [Treponema sp.]|jgi:hypothetical protein|nr:hypothetical protein [Treponema sp.]
MKKTVKTLILFPALLLFFACQSAPPSGGDAVRDDGYPEDSTTKGRKLAVQYVAYMLENNANLEFVSGVFPNAAYPAELTRLMSRVEVARLSGEAQDDFEFIDSLRSEINARYPNKWNMPVKELVDWYSSLFSMYYDLLAKAGN